MKEGMIVDEKVLDNNIENYIAFYHTIKICNPDSQTRILFETGGAVFTISEDSRQTERQK